MPELYEQMPVLAASIVMATARPDDAMAVTWYVVPFTLVGFAGGVEVNVMVCDTWLNTTTGIDAIDTAVFVTLSTPTLTS